MKNNKGVTLTSLVIYVIVLMIVIGFMSILSGYFFKNINKVYINESAEEQYLKLTAFITKDTNSEDLIFVKQGVDGKQNLIFKFTNGETHQYILFNNAIYFLNLNNTGQTTKKLRFCSNVKPLSGNNIFDYDESNSKVTINFTINNKNYNSSFNVKT